MSTTFEITSITDLNADFLEKLKTLFNGQNMIVTVAQEDETDYLLSNENNRAFLIKSLEEAKEGNTIAVRFESL